MPPFANATRPAHIRATTEARAQPDGVTRVRVTIDGVSGEVDARDNVVGRRAAVSVPRRCQPRVELLRNPG
jgi:hypothetical protein